MADFYFWLRRPQVCTLLIVGVAITTHATSEDKPADKTNAFDPSGYLKEKTIPNKDPSGEQIKESDTKINGIPFKIYRNGDGTIIVPDAGRFRPSDLDSASCTNLDSISTQKNTIAGGEQKLSENMKIYASLIQTTIVSKCGQNASQKIYVDPNAEVGIKFKDDKKRGSPTYRLYKRYSEPGVGASVEF